MRNMSFSLTTPQFLDGTKDVTRRKGWKFLKPGEHVMACEKCMGLKKGEKIKRLGEIEIVSVRREPLSAIDPEDVPREGFPHLATTGFMKMFQDHMGGTAGQEVTRIEFRRIESRGSTTARAALTGPRSLASPS